MGFQSELDTGTVLIDREELAALRAELKALKIAVLYASCHVKPGVPSYFCEEKAESSLIELFALVPGAPVGGGS